MKEFILRKVASFYPANFLKSEFLHKLSNAPSAYIYGEGALWKTLMRTKFFLLVHHKHFGKAQHMVF